jgi:hypothetical protein
MQEPQWDQIRSETQSKRPAKGDLVWVVSRTRGRFGALALADIGSHGIVISSWSSKAYGTQKICILCADGIERATTASCARTYNTLSNYHIVEGWINPDEPEWDVVYAAWMTATYVPIIVQRQAGYGRGRWAQSRDKTAYLVKSLSSQSKIWLNKDKVHPEDWTEMNKSDSVCVSVRVPVWVAKKSGLFSDDCSSK